MTWENGEFFEREAVALHTVAGLDPTKVNCPVRLAQRMNIAVLPTLGVELPGGGYSTPDDPMGPAIFVDTRLSQKRRRFVVAHEIAEILISRAGYEGPHREWYANRFGAAILLPRPAVIEALRLPWRGLRDFASRLRVSETCAGLRLGETTGDAVAVVCGRNVEVRGGAWPFEEPPERLAWTRRLPREAFRYWVEKDRVVVGAR